MSGIGATEIILVVVVIVALFSAKKIPEFVRGISKAIKEFKSASK